MVSEADAFLLARLPFRILPQIFQDRLAHHGLVLFHHRFRLGRVELSQERVPFVQRALVRLVGDTVQHVARFDEGWQVFLRVFACFRIQSFVEGATATREEYSQRGHRDCFSEFHIVYIIRSERF